MIEYFHTPETGRALARTDEETPGCWIALFDPAPKELEHIERRFSIDHDDAQAALDLDEVSRIERADDYTMFIVDTPLVAKSTHSGKRRYTTIPIAIFETPHHVVTVCSVHRVPIIGMLKAQRQIHSTADIKEFTIDLLMASSSAYFSVLTALNRRRIELSSVSAHPSRKDLEELYALDASLVYMKTSLTTNDTIFERYRRYALANASDEVIELFDDMVIENRQALDTTKLYSEILDSTIDHFGLIMDYDLNHTMQLVATLTLALCVPTIIGGLFGMNLSGIPLAGSPHGFAIVTGITAVVLAVMLYVLKRLRWF